jgi:hypothetical protein
MSRDTSESNPKVAELAQRLSARMQGRKRAGAMNYTVNFSELMQFVDVVDELAPEFERVFRHGADALAPGSGRVDPVVAVRVLRAALDPQPDAWFLRLMLAYYLVSDLNETQGAAEQLALAAKHPDAPYYAGSLARRLSAFAPGLVPEVAGEARLFVQMDEVQARVDAHRRDTGRLPARLADVCADDAGRALLAKLEVELTLSPDGRVVTRESQVREELARERTGRFTQVKPYVLPDY